ncbi:MAG TPA: zf-HC2 domain-containing protein [Vicinamibacterales bacterium]|nr:zf-HC2 domain-containing protein [Vicinamibacterales bacterium]
MTADPRRPPCPDAEQLAAFADGGLSAGERELIERHLTECDDCYEALVEIAAITAQIAAPMAPAASRMPAPLRPRRRLWWIGGLAAAASIVLLLNVWARSRPDAIELAVDALAQAPRQARLGLGRLSVDRTFAAALPVLRSGSADAFDWLDVKSAAHRLKVLAEQDPSQRGLHAYGLALAASREYDAAVDAFESALRQEGPDEAMIRSDLSASLLERHRLKGVSADADRALLEADRALRVAPQHLNATFNRAQALHELRRPEARQAFQAYIDLDRDPASGWLAEATRLRDAER